MAETPISQDLELVPARLEQLALGLAADLARRQSDAAALVRARLQPKLDGTPERPGAWFRVGDPGLMARAISFADRLVNSAN